MDARGFLWHTKFAAYIIKTLRETGWHFIDLYGII